MYGTVKMRDTVEELSSMMVVADKLFVIRRHEAGEIILDVEDLTVPSDLLRTML